MSATIILSIGSVALSALQAISYPGTVFKANTLHGSGTPVKQENYFIFAIIHKKHGLKIPVETSDNFQEICNR